jgi:preprotein translocase subunit SecA
LNPLNLLSKIIKSPNQREIERLKKIVLNVNNLEQNFKTLKDDEFHQKTNQLKERLKNAEKIDLVLPEAFALAREASKRILGERHFDVQIMGGVVLHEGKIAEMKTGEGKTLTITLAAYLNALRNKGVHVVTVNDYLAKRDCFNMSKIYNFLGLSAGYINNDQSDSERKVNYDCDITYATNSELGFDYLRDNMKHSVSEMVQRGHEYAIVDEIDSCLIDEARTPLIISGAAENRSEQYKSVEKIVRSLSTDLYCSDLFSAAPDIISGVLASSIRHESISSTIAYSCPL